jgi:AmiR/NasT family two-component response regulator
VTSQARLRGDLVTQLQGALDSRIVMEQAKGVLTERDGLSDLEAFDRLRRQARSRSITINLWHSVQIGSRVSTSLTAF